MDQVTRVFDLIPHALHRGKDDALFFQKIDGRWQPMTVADFAAQVNCLSLGLLQRGISPTDRVAIIGQNSREWNLADFAIQQIGAVSVPIYPTMTDQDYAYIFQDAEVKLVFVHDAELAAKVKRATTGLTQPPAIYTFLPAPGYRSQQDLIKEGGTLPNFRLEGYRAAVQGNDLLTLIYTSGTTGVPKGVMLTHNNLVSNFTDSLPAVPVVRGQRALSFLPLCHVYERMIIYLYMRVGLQIYYAESMDTIAANLKEVQPHIFTTVPRLLEKVYDRILQKGLELGGIKRALFFWALNLGQRYEPGKARGLFYNLQLWLARKLVFAKWQEALGGNIVVVVVGSAALQPRLARVFWGAGIPVLEGYGLTETSPVVAVNRIEERNTRVGTVGILLDNVQVQIAPDGEIMVKGPNIMSGYYKQPEMTAQVITPDGWLHTGDIGELVEGRFLRITDRKKEMFKTSGGKYVAPQMIENKLKESMVIEQVMVVGDGRKFPGALVIPNFAALRDWAKLHNLDYTTDAEMINHPQVLAKFEKEIDAKNASLGQWERIKKFRLLPRLWAVDKGELTPTMKLKRKVLLQQHAAEIESLYEGE